jgi:uncharacterized membrane protein YeaQ/YmgE (transglycosylase-associated protein family)
MGFITYIIFGGLVGWVASIFMGTDNQQSIILNIVVGRGGIIKLLVMGKAVSTPEAAAKLDRQDQ